MTARDAAGLDIECERALLGELATWTLPLDDTWTWGFTEGFRTGWAARPAPTAAPRDDGVVGAVLRELEWRHWSTRDGDGRMCLICERDESKGHAPECRMAAAIEAARGEG